MTPLRRHIDFLKAVFLYTISAFGGPQGHLGMMIKTFVEKRKDITEAELIEFNAFCQMLPGPASTQTVMLIGWKRGGPLLAIITLIVWVLPAAIIMGAFSFLITYMTTKEIKTDLFHYIHPMTIGFVIFTALKMMKQSVRNLATWLIMIGSAFITIFIHSPWVFPILLITSGFITNLTDKRIPAGKIKPIKIKWLNVRIFVYVFLGLGILSELSRIYQWELGRLFNLGENFYRFGSFVFGGGQALLPMMMFQFISQPIARGGPSYMTSNELFTGFGLVQAIPGPVFSVCIFAGGLAMSEYGQVAQFFGCLVSLIAIYLPSVLMVLFFFPLYQNLKNHVMIFRALEGINAMIIGIIWASGILFMKEIFHINIIDFKNFSWVNKIEPISILVIIATYLLLKFTKVPAPVIVISWLVLGWLLGG